MVRHMSKETVLPVYRMFSILRVTYGKFWQMLNNIYFLYIYSLLFFELSSNGKKEELLLLSGDNSGFHI